MVSLAEVVDVVNWLATAVALGDASCGIIVGL